MKRRWLKYTIGGVLLLLLFVLIGSVSLYWYLEPTRYFSRNPHPVLGEPHSFQNEQTKPLQEAASSPQATSSTPQETSQKPAQSKPDPSFNVLILGIDEAEASIARTDVIMFAHVDPVTKKVSLLSIPRDTKVKIDGVGYTKINHAHVLGNLHGGNHAGTTAAIQSVTELLDLPVNYYVKVSFRSFEHFVDQIGGVDVNLPYQIKAFPSGVNHLNGTQALEVARERHSLPRGDMDRQVSQSLILKSILTKVLEPNNIPQIPELYQKVKQDMIDTNFTDTDLLSLSLLFKGLTGEGIRYDQLPGKGSFAMDPLVKAQLYYWIPDTEALKSIVQSFKTN
ncbi:LCP family protein [Brevibacillus ginsengisoli]|uniref:LCP family protein n=1 Tax=Brevibacillus ginsengisoli TaxID=363854 RepID=UPI003CF2AB47